MFKTKKRVLSMITVLQIVLSMCFFTYAVNAYGSDPSAQLPTLTDIAPGTDVQIPITFKGLPDGTKSFDVGVVYDNTKLTYKSFNRGVGYSADPQVNTATTGKLGIAGLTTDDGVSGDQVIITLLFSVNANATDGVAYLTLSNVKYGDTNSANIAISSDKLINGAVVVKKPIDPLDAAKSAAKDAINTAFATYHQADYSVGKWNELNNIKTTGITTIDNAGTIDAVTTAKNDTLTSMSAVKTKGLALGKIRSGQFTVDDIKDTGANNVADANYNAYKLGMQIKKELKNNIDLELEDVDNVIETANAVTPEMRGDVVVGGKEDGISANDASIVKQFSIRTGKTTLTLNQALKADSDNDGAIDAKDISAILKQAAKNNVPR